jgi:SPP1 family phage portal protein
MELSQLTALSANPAEMVSFLLKNLKPYFQYEAFKDYDIIFHDVLDKAKRKDKLINKPTGQTLPDGSAATGPDTVPVNRIAIPLQKLIVETAATFLTGGCIDLKCTPDNDEEQAMYDAIKTIWKRNKLGYKNSQIATHMMSETEVAELWFSDTIKDATGKEITVMKMNILAPSNGYQLQPIFDGINNLIAFGVYYTGLDNQGKKVEYYDLYTEDKLQKHEKAYRNKWQIRQDEDGNEMIIDLPYGKIPIIYYQQPKSEWYDVQHMIERLEKMQSNHGDTNDYSGSPILFIQGKIQGFAAKGEPGKVLQGEGDAKASYIAPENAPESMKLEWENLKNLIFLCTQTPDLSLESLKGLGQIPSGAAFERMLIATYMKARKRQVGQFGECIQRRVNFLVSAAATIDAALASQIDLDINVEYGLYQIGDITDRIQNALLANGNKPVISQEESVEMAGLTDDPEGTFKKIQDEQNSLGNVFDGLPTPAPKPQPKAPVTTK